MANIRWLKSVRCLFFQPYCRAYSNSDTWKLNFMLDRWGAWKRGSGAISALRGKKYPCRVRLGTKLTQLSSSHHQQQLPPSIDSPSLVPPPSNGFRRQTTTQVPRLRPRCRRLRLPGLPHRPPTARLLQLRHLRPRPPHHHQSLPQRLLP